MKTSFYFVLWIVIYPILGLLDSPIIDRNSFMVALLVVWGVSWLLNKLMPETLVYERSRQITPILEDAYTGNVTSFTNRLNRDLMVEGLTTIYFSITTIALLLSTFVFGAKEWIALAVFAFLTIGAVASCAKMLKAKSALEANPSAEQCAEIAEDTYKLNYTDYRESREGRSYEQMIPPRPKNFTAFEIVSILFAAASAILGLYFVVKGVLILFVTRSIDAGAFVGMFALYGTLAVYFGIKDIISIVRFLNAKPRQNRE
ncbi:MAG: hypothetical protein J1E63_02935 [Muribaculaceae bacterium]|nr:hypothetical protein [Muribaculaceae bacterium]